MINIDWDKINDLVRKVDVEDILKTSRKEIKKTAESGIDTVLKRLNIVSREEFSAQSELLVQMCDRVQEIQKRLDTIKPPRKRATGRRKTTTRRKAPAKAKSGSGSAA